MSNIEHQTPSTEPRTQSEGGVGERVVRCSTFVVRCSLFAYPCFVNDEITAVELRVRYAETDQMGVAHHTHYLVWCEVARTDHMRRRGVSYRELEGQGLRLAVVEAGIRYRQPARRELSTASGRRWPGQSVFGRSAAGGAAGVEADCFFVSPRIDSSRSFDALRNSRTPRPSPSSHDRATRDRPEPTTASQNDYPTPGNFGLVTARARLPEARD